MTTILWATVWGIVGGLLAQRIGLPGGAAVGAMFGSGLYNLLISTQVPLPPSLEIGAQIAVGVSIGFSFNRELLSNAGLVLFWALVGALVFLTVGLLLAFLVSRFSPIDFSTALFGFSPGGFTGMSILAAAEGGNAAIVALIHFVRVVLLFVIVPLLVRLLVR